MQTDALEVAQAEKCSAGACPHLLQLIKLWVCASGILASIFRDFPADVGPVESPIQLILPIQTASASKQRGPGPRMARKMVMTIRILKHQNPVLRN